MKLLLPQLPLKLSHVCWGKGSLLFHCRKQHQVKLEVAETIFPTTWGKLARELSQHRRLSHESQWEGWGEKEEEEGDEETKKRERQRESLRHHFKRLDLTDSKTLNHQILPLPFFVFIGLGPHHAACRTLVPLPGIKPVSPALEIQGLNHRTAREVPALPPF